MKLPNEIKADVQERLGASPAQVAVRALADLDGNLGEAHVISNGRTLLVYSRKLGDSMQVMQVPLVDITRLDLEEDRPFAFLHVGTATLTFSLKFGTMDSAALQAVISLWQKASDGGEEGAAAPSPAATDEAAAPESSGLTPFVAFCAALYSMMEVDGMADAEERHQLERLVGRPEIVTRAIEYLRRDGVDKLLEELPKVLDKEQRLCLMANLVELAMIDGYLRGAEQVLLQRFLKVLQLSTENYDAIYEILTIKNDLSGFTS